MNAVLAVTGASGAYAARVFAYACPWPVSLIASRWGREVYERECGAFAELEARVDAVYDDTDLAAPLASGSVPTRGMVVLPCSCDTLSAVGNGAGDTLIARAAHCHLKERRPLILCVRESPWTLIDLENARRVAAAGGTVMPLSPPFYMAGRCAPEKIDLATMLAAYVDRVLALLGHAPPDTWETVR